MCVHRPSFFPVSCPQTTGDAVIPGHQNPSFFTDIPRQPPPEFAMGYAEQVPCPWRSRWNPGVEERHICAESVPRTHPPMYKVKLHFCVLALGDPLRFASPNTMQAQTSGAKRFANSRAAVVANQSAHESRKQSICRYLFPFIDNMRRELHYLRYGGSGVQCAAFSCPLPGQSCPA